MADDVDLQTMPSLYLVLIGRAGSGKSPALKKYCKTFLRAIERKTNKKKTGNPATFAALRDFFEQTNGFGTILVDEIYSWFIQFTTKPEGNQGIGLINEGWSGGELVIEYKRAKCLDLPESCVNLIGGLHPFSAAQMQKLWINGNGFKNRVLQTIVGPQKVTTRKWFDVASSRKGEKIEYLKMFFALHMYFMDKERMIFIPTEKALQAMFEISEKVLTQDLEDSSSDESASESEEEADIEPRGTGKYEEVIIHVAQVLHVFINAATSFNKTGEISIPRFIQEETILGKDEFETAEDFLKVDRDTILTGAMKYVEKSEGVARVFDGTEKMKSYAQILLIDGPFVYPRLVSEAYHRRNRPKFVEQGNFRRYALKLENLKLGSLRSIEVTRSDGKWSKLQEVFYKKPPSMIEKGALLKIGMTPQEYKDHYQRQFSISRSTERRLRSAIKLIGLQNPYLQSYDHSNIQSEMIVNDRSGSTNPEHNLAATDSLEYAGCLCVESVDELMDEILPEEKFSNVAVTVALSPEEGGPLEVQLMEDELGSLVDIFYELSTE